MYSLFTKRIQRHDTPILPTAQIPGTNRKVRWIYVKEAGFSLVEVALAIGIISFCLLTMLGLLPTGLDALREAGQQTAQTQIVQQIASRAQLMPYEEITDFIANSRVTPYFYDESGLALDSRTPDARYEVTLDDGKTQYPGSSTDIKRHFTAIKVIVKPIASRQTNRYVIHVPNTKG